MIYTQKRNFIMSKNIKLFIALLISMALLATPLLAGVVKDTFTEDYDLDGDGVIDITVTVERTIKDSKNVYSDNRMYFSEDYEYLGQELTVNGDVIEDTFPYND